MIFFYYLPNAFVSTRLYVNDFLKPGKHKDGYLQTRLVNNRKRSCKLIHCLVAKAFCSGYFNGAEVNHKNGIKPITQL